MSLVSDFLEADSSPETVDYLRKGFFMINSIEIQNFRCFRSINIPNFRRINIIVGRNASGKTALLEAIFLASGASPELCLRIKGWRSEGQVLVSTDQSSYDDMWKDLFHKFKRNQTILIEFKGSSGFSRSLKIVYETSPSFFVPMGADAKTLQSFTPIKFIYTDGNGNEHSSSATISEKGLKIEAANFKAIRGNFFATQIPFSQQQYAALFSELSKQKKRSQIVESLQTEFPFIKDVTIETDSGGRPALWADLDDLPEKAPIALVSSGINKLLCLLIAIASQPNGIVIIDEIENGFYYDRLPSIWKLIHRFAKEHDVQVFASTHSSECLQALTGAMELDEEAFSLIRMEVEDGDHTPKQFYGKTFLAALKQHGEVR